MAIVRVILFATLREIAGVSEMQADANDVSGLLEHLSDRFGKNLADQLLVSHSDAFVVLVNGRNTGQLQGLETTLRDGDEVALFPPVSGG